MTGTTKPARDGTLTTLRQAGHKTKERCSILNIHITPVRITNKYFRQRQIDTKTGHHKQSVLNFIPVSQNTLFTQFSSFKIHDGVDQIY